MAQLSNSELIKRDNISVFVKRISGKGAFQLENKESPAHKATGRVQVTKGADPILYSDSNKFGEDDLDAYLDFNGSKNLQIEMKENLTTKFVGLTKIYKDKEFGGVEAKGGALGSERQETVLIEALNQAIAFHENPKVKNISGSIRKAYKQEGMSPIGKEPYIDVVVETDIKKIGVSCKDVSAPSLAGGGLAGIKLIVPDLLPKVYRSVINYMKTTLGVKQGDVYNKDSIPDIYVEIPKEKIRKILIGTSRMGGPVDYMYIGKMDVVYNTIESLITLNGNFYNISQYMEKIGKFYFRFRKRDVEPSNDVKIDFLGKSAEGTPKLLVGPKTNKNNTDAVPRAAAIIKVS